MSFDRDKLEQEIADDEGRVPHAYQDSLGFWTIGVGRLIDRRKGGRLREDEIDFLFDNDVAEKEAFLDRNLPWWRRLDDNRQRVLLNMAFQLGGNLLGFKNTLAAIDRGDWAAAAAGMRNSKWATQTPARVERLAKRMEGK